MGYAAAKRDLGEDDSITIRALGLLKECAEHLYENQHPVSAEEGEPIIYDRLIRRLERSHARDATRVANGVPTTITPRRG